MAKVELKLWGIRVRKVLVLALIAPLFTLVSAVVPQIASGATLRHFDFIILP